MNVWPGRFLDLARQVASWSKDPSTKVGCVIVDEKRRVVGMGFNGFARGVRDAAERYADRDEKYLFVQHAETNAIFNSTKLVEGCTAYVTHPPCANCMGAFIQAGIARVVTVRPDAGLQERLGRSFQAAELMAEEANVAMRYADD